MWSFGRGYPPPIHLHDVLGDAVRQLDAKRHYEACRPRLDAFEHLARSKDPLLTLSSIDSKGWASGAASAAPNGLTWRSEILVSQRPKAIPVLLTLRGDASVVRYRAANK